MLAQARAGRAGALEAIYRELHPHVLAYLRVHARDEAEDLAADTFVALASALPKFSGDWDGMRALVFTIARRRAQDHARRAIRRRTDPTDSAEIPLPSSRDASGGALDHLGDEDARRLVAGLPPDQAQVILLRVLGDLSVERTAQILGKRPGAVRGLQLRALRRLARELGARP